MTTCFCNIRVVASDEKGLKIVNFLFFRQIQKNQQESFEKMASSKENCQNCLQTFYTQSLFPLELEDFKFGGQILTLIGCFMESPVRPVPQDCPKICRTCLELLKTTFTGGEHSLTQRATTRKPFHICVACSEFFPANVMMSMHLTVVNCNRQSVKLIDCYKACMNQQDALSGSNLMVCLACVSTITENFRQFYGRDVLEESSSELVTGNS
jgi:hypothetical protein